MQKLTRATRNNIHAVCMSVLHGSTVGRSLTSVGRSAVNAREIQKLFVISFFNTLLALKMKDVV